MVTIIKRLLLLITYLAISLNTGNLSAQESERIEVITVTAQKREENIQDVPIAINSYTGARLVDSGIENTIDLQVVEPSLVFTTNAAFGQPYLRGVGTDLFTPGAESSIATFVDDIYQSRTISALQDFYDVQRVDVVKGPQGVLFGRNAVGGAINVYSNKPTDELEGYFSGTIGNFSKTRVEGALNVPLSDGVAWRIAGLISNRDGYTDNIFTGGDVDDEDYYSLRTHLDIALSDDAGLLITGNYSNEDSSRSIGSRVDTSEGLAIADMFGAIRPSDVFEVALNEDNSVDIETYSLAATLDWNLGDVALKSITAYRETDAAMLLDLDASQLDFASNEPMQDSETFSQELQLISQADSSLEWILGLYYLQEDASQQLNLSFNFPMLSGVPASQQPPNDTHIQPDGSVDTTSIGVFGNAKYWLSDAWAISAGLRYNYDERDLDFLQTVSSLSTGNVLAASPLVLSDSYEEVTPRVVVEYSTAEDTLLYFSASRGYKAGGFNTNVFQPEGFEPELLWAYEAGIKSIFWDGRARVNSAFFYYDYKNLQLNTIPPGSPVGTFQIVINAAQATIQGWEADALFAATDNLELNIGIQLLDARFDSFVATNPNDVAAGEVDRSGDRLPRAPETSINLGARYAWLVNDREMTLRADYRYESAQFLDIFEDDAVRRGSNSTINAHLSYDFSDNMSLSLWGRNLTNEETVQSSLRVDGLFGTIQFLAPPRTYGATLKVNF